MLQHDLCGSLVLSIIICFIYIYWYCPKTIVKEVMVVKEAPVKPMKWLSDKAKNQWMMDQLLMTDLKGDELSDEDNIFLNRYYVKQIAQDFDDDLRDAMNAMRRDDEDGRAHSIDPTAGNREVVLSFAEMSVDKKKAATIAIQKGYAAEHGSVHWESVEVTWTKIQGPRRLAEANDDGTFSDANHGGGGEQARVRTPTPTPPPVRD